MSKTTQKSKYEAPKLTEFGSVRNLTGGSGGAMMDGMLMMSLPGGMMNMGMGNMGMGMGFF